jgi:hypothetical protein
MLRTAKGWFFILFFAIFQAPICGYDFDDIRRFMITIFGAGILMSYAIFKKPLDNIEKLTFAGLGVLIALSALNWVGGYSIYSIAFFAAVLILPLFLRECKLELLIYAVLAACIFQFFAGEMKLIPWTNDFGGQYSFGSVRHAIRYSTYMLAGVVVSAIAMTFKKYRKDRFMVSLCAIATFLSVLQIFNINYASQTVQTLFFVFLIVSAFMYTQSFFFFPMLFVIAVTATFTYLANPSLFAVDLPRFTWWAKAFELSFENVGAVMFGHGVEAWRLICATFQFPPHPHNEIIHILYEFGIVGVFAALFGVISVFVEMVKKNILAGFGFAVIVASFLTNSGRYPDMAILASIFAGIGLNKCESL